MKLDSLSVVYPPDDHVPHNRRNSAFVVDNAVLLELALGWCRLSRSPQLSSRHCRRVWLSTAFSCETPRFRYRTPRWSVGGGTGRLPTRPAGGRRSPALFASSDPHRRTIARRCLRRERGATGDKDQERLPLEMERSSPIGGQDGA